MPRRIRIARLPFVLIALAFAAACGDMKELFTLSALIAKEFGSTASVNSSMDSGVSHLTVTFSNSPLAEQPETKRQATARKVAEFVRDRYAKYPTLHDVTVVFETSKSVGPAGFRATDGSYAFTTEELGKEPVGEVARPAEPSRPFGVV